MATADSTQASLAEQAYDELRRRIISCTIAPGAWVTESGLATELGLGKTPTREALRRLASDGFARPAHRRGYQIAPITIGRAIEIFEAFAVLVPELAVLVSKLASEADKQRLAATAGAASSGENGDVEPAVSLFVELCGNPTIIEMAQGVVGQVERIINVAASHGALADPAYVDAFTATLETIDRGDADEVRAAALGLIDATRSSVLDALASAPSVLATPIDPPGSG